MNDEQRFAWCVEASTLCKEIASLSKEIDDDSIYSEMAFQMIVMFEKQYIFHSMLTTFLCESDVKWLIHRAPTEVILSKAKKILEIVQGIIVAVNQIHP